MDKLLSLTRVDFACCLSLQHFVAVATQAHYSSNSPHVWPEMIRGPLALVHKTTEYDPPLTYYTADRIQLFQRSHVCYVA